MGIKQKIVNRIAKERPILLTPNFVKSDAEFSGKRALVIGGGTGIGLAIAQELKASGADVIICGRKERQIDGMTFATLDVSRIEYLSDKLDELVNKYQKLDIVVNSQGICPEADFKQDFFAVDQNDFEKVIGINLESVYFVNQYFCKYYVKNNITGNILNICSTEGLKGNVVPYGISKAAVISLTKGIGKKMAAQGITVNGIAPGATATNMMNMSSAGNLRRNYIPSERVNIPMEIAKTAHLLLSDAGRQMCGQVIVVDGGESLH